MAETPAAVVAADVVPRTRSNGYPPDLARRVAGREKQALGDVFGLVNFGVNLTTLAPGAASSMRHRHARQDEFVYVLQGHPVLVTDAGETTLGPGMCAGFRAGGGNAHCLVNRSALPVVLLEVGDRSRGDVTTYPDDDLAGEMGDDGKWRYSRKDGTPL